MCIAMVCLEHLLGLAVGYVVLVLFIETVVWRFQPPMEGALRLVVHPDKPSRMERRLDTFEHEGALYVSSNHWFRSWYKAVLHDPDVQVIRDGAVGRYRAEAVLVEARKTLLRHYKMGFWLRFLCGFAPSRFLRLVPRPET